jgi:hypothetical protein
LDPLVFFPEDARSNIGVRALSKSTPAAERAKDGQLQKNEIS